MGQEQSTTSASLLKSSQEQLQPGDLIEIFQGYYNHWVLYVGDGDVIHMTMPAARYSGFFFPVAYPRTGLVKKEPLSAVAGNGSYRIHHKKYECNSRSREQILRDAEALVGKAVECDSVGNNCEVFLEALFHGVFDSELANLEPGDLIEIFRGTYSHWAVYVGGGNVVHMSVPDGALGVSVSSVASAPNYTANGLVMKEPLSRVVGGGKYRVNNKHDKTYGHKPREEIVRDAEAMAGKSVAYSLLGNNCEHFATKLRHGVAVSEQAQEAEQALIRAGGSGIGAGVGTLWGLSSIMESSLAALGAAGMTSMAVAGAGVASFASRNSLQRR